MFAREVYRCFEYLKWPLFKTHSSILALKSRHPVLSEVPTQDSSSLRAHLFNLFTFFAKIKVSLNWKKKKKSEEKRNKASDSERRVLKSGRDAGISV